MEISRGVVALLLVASAWAPLFSMEPAGRTKATPAKARLIAGFTPLAENPQGLREYRHKKTGILFVELPPGEFLMGTPQTVVEQALLQIDETKRKSLAQVYRSETPQHRVRLSAFLIAKFEVTQKEWRTIADYDLFKERGERLPATRTSWADCQEFCAEAGLALPTEAEWEYACRAGTTGKFADTGKLEDVGWFLDNSGEEHDPVAGRVYGVRRLRAVGEKRSDGRPAAEELRRDAHRVGKVEAAVVVRVRGLGTRRELTIAEEEVQERDGIRDVDPAIVVDVAAALLVVERGGLLRLNR